MIKAKLISLLAVVLMLAAGCHEGIEEGDETYCQDVEDVYSAVQEAPLDTAFAREEVYTDITELGAAGHCPGYEGMIQDD